MLRARRAGCLAAWMLCALAGFAPATIANAGAELSLAALPGDVLGLDEDKAAGRPAIASSVEAARLAPGRAVDGDPGTRWSSAFADGQWWQVDLGSARQVSLVEIVWETAYASRYRVLTSLDGESFSEAAVQTAAASGSLTTSFAARAARYLRIEALQRATQWGASFWEVGVYGPSDTPGDTAPPDTTISSGPSGTVGSGSATLAFESSEPGSTFECRLDDARLAACGSPADYSGLGDGPHTFEVRATDPAGNVDASPAARTWTSDTSAPETRVTSAPSGTVATGLANIGFGSSEPGSTFECRLDSGGWAGCSSPRAYAGLQNGSHTFEVRATDAVGNLDGSSASATWTVDVPLAPPPPAPPPPPSGPGDVFVSTSGSDVGDCTSAAPCRTFARAYAVAAAGDVVSVAAGIYPAQTVPSGSKAVTFRGVAGAKLRALDNSADNVTFHGLEVDGNFARAAGFENHGADNVTFRNGRIGNVTDEKGALVSGANFTFERVVFHDVRVTDPLVHNECLYAIVVPGMTVRDSLFYECATMDVFFTYGHWWSPKPPPYGNVTLENNVFGHSTMAGGAWHYYSLNVGDTGSDGGTLSNWVVRYNTFEIDATVSRGSSSGSRWVGNLGDWDCIPGVTYRYNVGRKCAGSDKAVLPAASTPILTAPLGWVNPVAHDFHLTATSPAIDAGDPNEYPATDRDGTQRPAGSAPDAGAYERP